MRNDINIHDLIMQSSAHVFWETIFPLYRLSWYFLQIDKVFKLCDEFFQLDPTVKQKYARPASGSGHGWVAFEREK